MLISLVTGTDTLASVTGVIKPPYKATFDGHAKMIRKAICDLWHILKSDRQIGRLFTNRPKFVYKRGRSIGDQLVRTDVQKREVKGLRAHTDRRGTHACLSCQNCTSIIKGDVVHHPMQGQAIKIKGFYTCSSPNVIYGLKCPCGQMYVGQITRQVKVRINEHRSSIRLYKTKMEREDQKKEKIDTKITNTKYGETTVARHFYQNNHKVSDLKWMVLEQIEGNNNRQIQKQLLKREFFWISTLATVFPDGMNEKFNFSVYL